MALTLPLAGRSVLLKVHMARLSDRHPPNSLAALAECLAAGATWVEIDLSCLADGRFAVLHGPYLDQETTGTGLIRATTTADLRRCYLRHHGEPTAERPALLEEVLDLVRAADLALHLDLKDQEPLPDEAVDYLVDQLVPLRDRLIVGSTSLANLWALHTRRPDLPLGFDPLLHLDYRPLSAPTPRAGPHGYVDTQPPAAGTPLARHLRERLGELVQAAPFARAWFVRGSLLLRLLADGVDAVAELRRHGVERVEAWTIDYLPGDPGPCAQVRALVALGVSAIITNTARAWLDWARAGD